MYRTGRSIFITFILCVTFISGVAAEQHFDISKSPDKDNTYPRALALPNGNVLVAWTERTKVGLDSIFKVYTALCVRNANGKFTVRAPVLVSAHNEKHAGGDLAYNPAAGNVIITFCRNRTIKIPECCNVADIITRILDIEGRPVGVMRPIMVSDESDSNAVPVYVGTGDRKYLLFFKRKSPKYGNPGQIGLWTVFLNAEGQVISEPKRYYTRANDPDDVSDYYPGFVHDVLLNNDKTFTVVASLGFDEGSNPEEGYLYRVDGYLYRLNKEGGFAKRKLIATGGDCIRMSIARMRKTEYLVSWFQSDYATGGIFSRIYKLSLIPKGKSEKLLPERKNYHSAAVKLSSDPGSYVVFVSEGQLWGQYFKKNGKPRGEARMLAKGFGKLSAMKAVAVQGSSQVFVAWQERMSNKPEVFGVVVDALDE